MPHYVLLLGKEPMGIKVCSCSFNVRHWRVQGSVTCSCFMRIPGGWRQHSAFDRPWFNWFPFPFLCLFVGLSVYWLYPHFVQSHRKLRNFNFKPLRVGTALLPSTTDRFTRLTSSIANIYGRYMKRVCALQTNKTAANGRNMQICPCMFNRSATTIILLRSMSRVIIFLLAAANKNQPWCNFPAHKLAIWNMGRWSPGIVIDEVVNCSLLNKYL